MAIKVEKYLDIGCDICGRHRSTDFSKGMYIAKDLRHSTTILRDIATKEGWKSIGNTTYCPICAYNINKEGKHNGQ